jgi:predicted TIM-barrel fold metal-dependent hydrolase
VPYPIIDSHIHVWEPDRPDRPWHQGGVNIGPPLSAEQLLDDARAAGVTKIVQVTPSIMGWDNRYGIESAQRYPDQFVGVIGRFDPTAPEMPRRLAELRAQREILGVRITLIKDWTAWLEQGVLEPFFAEAGKLGLRLQLYGPDQALAMRAAALRHGGTIFLIDHTALDHHAAQPFANWNDVLDLADAPNVYVKASYFPEVSKEKFPFRDTVPYLESLLERFGADRLIWGSNYPPSQAACSYAQNVAYLHESGLLSEAEKAKVFGATLLRALGL